MSRRSIRLIIALAVFGTDLALALAAPAAEGLRWQSGPGYRWAQLTVAPHEPGFTRRAPAETGVTFTNSVAEDRHLTNQILLNGSGVAAGDVDGDGWCDLYFCALDGLNRLYRNLGAWKFEDITAAAGVACPDADATGAALVDFDGDGDFDLAVNTLGSGTRLFRNEGGARFTEWVVKPALNAGKGATSMAWGDVDGDGFLDLYIANYRTSALMDMPNARATFRTLKGKLVVDRVNGRPVTDPEFANRFFINARGAVEELGEVDAFYWNRGGTNFVPVDFTAGTFLDENGKPLGEPPFDWGLAAMFYDLNGDQKPDLYVCNDFESPDRVWLNQGNGQLRALPRLALRKTSRFSMGIDFSDINRDGHVDFFVVDMLSRDHRMRLTQLEPPPEPLEVIRGIAERPQYMRNTLLLNRGNGTFAEIAHFAGLEASEWSWMPLFLDVDLDGWEDVLISNGQERAARDLDVAEELLKLRAAGPMTDRQIFQARRRYPRLAPANLAFRNRGDLTFADASRAWGFADTGVSQGMALADLDHDGDLDVVVNNLNGAAGLYRNEGGAPRVAVRLSGQLGNRPGIGARITVAAAEMPRQSQEIIAGGRYLSSDEPIRAFATGKSGGRLEISVTWPNGMQTRIADAEPNRIYEVAEPAPAESYRGGAAKDPGASSRSPPLFDDVSGQLAGAAHQDAYFDDFARQPLLPRAFSTLGPGIAWFDLDGDGREDLIVAAGRGGQTALLRNTPAAWQPMVTPALAKPVTREQGAIVGYEGQDGQRRLLLALSNYDDGLKIGPFLREVNFPRQTLRDLTDREATSGPLALADIDGDGALELFIGARLVPGQYPRAGASALYRVTTNGLTADPSNSRVLAHAGLVSAAVFFDWENDGDPDLALACEWGPVRIFLNTGGQLAEATAALQMTNYSGWWNGVIAADFDGDGRLDLAASNWGRNTPFESHRHRPLELLYGDFDTNGTLDLIEAFRERAEGKLVPERGLSALAAGMPSLRHRFSTHQAFARATVSDLIGSAPNEARRANWLESTIFLNRGDHCEPRPLPAEAQFAPTFGIAAADFNGDGFEDLFLAQNFFGLRPDLPRHDAGAGLCLLGNGDGTFRALNPTESGVALEGEGRGCAVADFDQDGRVDVAVGQQNGPIALLRNRTGTPGLRVRFAGSGAGRSPIGTTLQPVYSAGRGPIKQVAAGSGYWSQDSSVVVLSGQPIAIKVRFPHGAQFEVRVPEGAQELTIPMPTR